MNNKNWYQFTKTCQKDIPVVVVGISVVLAAGDFAVVVIESVEEVDSVACTNPPEITNFWCNKIFNNDGLITFINHVWPRK